MVLFASVFPLELERSRGDSDLAVSAHCLVFGMYHQPTSANLKLPAGGATGAAVGSPVTSTSLFAMLDVVIIVELKPNRPSRAMTEMIVWASSQRIPKTTASEKKE